MLLGIFDENDRVHRPRRKLRFRLSRELLGQGRLVRERITEWIREGNEIISYGDVERGGFLA